MRWNEPNDCPFGYRATDEGDDDVDQQEGTKLEDSWHRNRIFSVMRALNCCEQKLSQVGQFAPAGVQGASRPQIRWGAQQPQRRVWVRAWYEEWRGCSRPAARGCALAVR